MKTIGILGDSYSTFKGYIPEGNRVFYPYPEVPDVVRVEQTWWHLLMQKRGLKLLVNESYSGATVCESVREGYPLDSAFTKRANRTFGADNQEKPGIIFFFGCTNDSWFDRPIGENQYENWTDEDLKQCLPAYCYIIHTLKTNNPESLVVAVINTGLKDEIRAGMLKACEHYGIPKVELHEIAKEAGHPNALGMTQIAQQVSAVLDTL